MQHKYVRHETVGFVLLPQQDDVWHAHIGDELLRRARGGLISAGFCSVQGGAVRCWGRSESLGLGGAPDDEQALAKQLGLTAPKKAA